MAETLTGLTAGTDVHEKEALYAPKHGSGEMAAVGAGARVAGGVAGGVAGKRAAAGYETYTPEQFPCGVARVVEALRGLARAETMQEFCEIMPNFARDVVWDAPPIMVGRKGYLRVAAYLAKFVASADLAPSLVEVKPIASDRSLLQITGTMHVYPKRTLLLPPTLLLPKDVPLRASLRVGVRGPLETGEIEFLYGRLHNLPALPGPLRAFNGLLFGTLPHLTEPLWSHLVEFTGDNFYRLKREREFKRHHPDASAPIVATSLAYAAKDKAADVTNVAMDYGSAAYDSARDYSAAAADMISGATAAVLGTAHAVTGKAVDTISGAAGGVGHAVTSTTAGGATATPPLRTAGGTTMRMGGGLGAPLASHC